MSKTFYEIKNGKKSLKQYFTEIAFYKYVFYELVKKDIKTLYVQSIFGPFFYILFPIIQSGIANFLLKSFTTFSLNEKNQFLIMYSVFGMWNFISGYIDRTSKVYINNTKIIRNIYFPRIIYFCVPYIVGLINYSIQVVILILIIIFLDNSFSLLTLIFFTKFICFVCVIIFTFLLCLGLSLIISSISLKYRDIIYILSYGLGALFFLSPVIYPLSELNDLKEILIGINPFSFIFEMIRYIFFDIQMISKYFYINLISTLVIFFIGVKIFINSDKYVSDLI
jgi:lipopolysaccharide transport system permease protein